MSANLNDAAGVVVLYNPNKGIIENINSYISQVGFLFIIDNSEVENSELLNNIKSKNYEYIFNGQNIGVAAALNKGAEAAMTEGYKVLLTMDQDSAASELMVQSMLQLLTENVGIVSPLHIETGIHKKHDPAAGVKEVDIVMTSGNLLNLSAYKKVGKFNELLFIDQVDHEYCLRVRKADYKILLNQNILLYHSLGNTRKRRFLAWEVYPANYSDIRYYYQTRNRFYVAEKYKNDFPGVIKSDLKSFRNGLIKLFLFEKNKWSKIKMIIKGYQDFKKGRMGKFNA